MAITASLFRPAAKITIYTETGPITLRSRPKDKSESIFSDVVAIQTTNDMQQDCGTFQISLVNRNHWDKKFAANDLVVIQLWRGSKDAKDSTIMFGLISDVRKDVGIQGQNVQRGITLSGQNFTKVLMNFNVGYVPNVDIQVADLGWMEGVLTLSKKNAAQITKDVWNKIIFKTTQYKFSNGKTLKDLVNLKLSCRSGEQLQDYTGFVNYEGDLNGFLQEVSDFPFNETFWETYNNKNYFVLRETPFNESNWKKLTLHTVSDNDIISYDKGRGDVEAYSIFSVGVQSYFDTIDPSSQTGVFPLWNKDFFEKYGIKILQWYTYYAGMSNGSVNGSMQGQLKAMQKDIYNWNIMNADFYNGTITVKGKNSYKLGDRLLVKSSEDGEDVEYYITSVQQNFVNFSYWQTVLGVTRGLPKSGSGRFKSPWGTYQQYKSNELGKLINQPSKKTGNSKNDKK